MIKVVTFVYIPLGIKPVWCFSFFFLVHKYGGVKRYQSGTFDPFLKLTDEPLEAERFTKRKTGREESGGEGGVNNFSQKPT